jgi:hypothetical protein
MCCRKVRPESRFIIQLAKASKTLTFYPGLLLGVFSWSRNLFGENARVEQGSIMQRFGDFASGVLFGYYNIILASLLGAKIILVKFFVRFYLC